MRKLCLSLLLLLAAGWAHADSTEITIPAFAFKDVAVTVPEGTRLLTVTATVDGGHAGKLDMYASDTEFTTGIANASYYSRNSDGTARLSIADWSHPALHAGTWHFALSNHLATTATVTFTTAVATSSRPNTVFEINFDEPSQTLKDVMGWTKTSDCDVGPWNDATPLDSDHDGTNDTTLGAFRKSLLIDATEKLAPQVHSAVPITVQACWTKYGDADDADSWTLAAAGPTYSFAETPGLPNQEVWYSTPAAVRLAGTKMCKFDPSEISCEIPDIVVRYNSDKVAEHNYDDVHDERLIVSVTVHELTHGLGFLSGVDTSPTYDDDDDASTDEVDNPDFGSFGDRNDIFTLNVGYTRGDDVTTFADLDLADAQAALESGTHLVWNDARLAMNPVNQLRGNSYPDDLVPLYAPSDAEPGSTLSHFDDDSNPGQLMDHFIQPNYPTTVGLAEPVLEKVGWSIDTKEAPIKGTWNDPKHSGHGIDLEPFARDPAGDIYAVEFYTFDDSGKSTFFLSSGRLRDGHYESRDTAGEPAPLQRPMYDPATHGSRPDPGYTGSLSIDFTGYAAADPACAGHTGEHLALMRWTINDLTRTWCIQPILAPEAHPEAAHDLNGLWNHGEGDSGWGFSVINWTTGDSTTLSALFYYYDKDNKSRWVQAEPNAYGPGTTFNLYQLTGYCRACGEQPIPAEQVGTLMLDLNAPDGTLTGNTLSIDIDNGTFKRTDVPVQMLSRPPGD
ncbi:MAG TPA: hypothetical protein VFG73_02685 [Rhodanobacteraceae bacterium]|nr:hypothetical protein [Rhodanobacteraceae bacterium]